MMNKHGHPQLDASFRDPSGFLFLHDNVLYRQVNRQYQQDYDHLLKSTLYDELVGDNSLISHREVTVATARCNDAYKVLRPEMVPFISYPYEWSFSQLKDAALLTLRIARRSLNKGMILKDASAYNVQFQGTRPVFIDTLSFERYREGTAWVAYRQFCQHFLAPLALACYTDLRLTQLLRAFLDGVPLDLASRLLPWRTRAKLGIGIHVHVHGRSQTKHASDAKIRAGRFSSNALRGLLENLESTVSRLRLPRRDTEWGNYYENTNYSESSFLHKQQVVREMLSDVAPIGVWDLGANTGVFSRIAAKSGAATVSFDVDPIAVERNYLSCRENGIAGLLPLIMDLANPSPAIGWHESERMSLVQRGPADAVLALALVHHLAISNNVPLSRLAAFFADMGRSLIIEFVPKADSQVKRLLATRNDIFPGYHREGFEAAFGRYFNLTRSDDLRDSVRTLYLMEKK